jgi:hypothetical protein
MPYYHAEVTESDGEHENSSPVIIEAEFLEESCQIANEVARTWYDGDVQDNGEWLYFESVGRYVKVSRVVPTTAEEFLQHHLFRRKT